MNSRFSAILIFCLASLTSLRADSPVSWVRDIPLPVAGGAPLSYSDTAYDDPTVHQIRNLQTFWRLQEDEVGSPYWNEIARLTGIKIDASTAVARDTSGEYLYILTRGIMNEFYVPMLYHTRPLAAPAHSAWGMTYDAGHLILATSTGPLSYDIASPSSGATPLLQSGTVGTSTIGAISKVVVGPDGQARLLDLENRRIITFAMDTADISDNFLGEFTLDINTTVVNSLAMSPWGNIYVGDGQGGGSIYDSGGTLLGTFGLPTGTPADPNVYVAYSSFENYLSSINVKSDGTIYVSDITGYHQYYDASVVPEPSSYALILGGLGVLCVMRRRARCLVASPPSR